MTDSHSGARVVVDLGCGSRKKLAQSVSTSPASQIVDVVADVMKTLPFRDNSVDEVFASHLVEHRTTSWRSWAKSGGSASPGPLVHFRFPHATTPFGIWRDPTHRRGVYLATFNYWDPSTFDGAYFGYYHPAKFKIVKQRLMYNMNADTFLPGRGRRVIGRIVDAVANRNDRWQYFCERFWGHLLGIEECQIWMRALK